MSMYSIILKRSAIADLDALRKYDATRIAEAMETHLQSDPRRESRSRIKRLRGIKNPDFRLRVADFRVFYTVDEDASQVVVLRIMHKDQTHAYYEELER